MPVISRAKSPQIRKYAMAYLFIAPLVISSVAFIFGPMVVSFWWSFTDYNGISSPHFVGFKNYVSLFSDPFFLAALRNTTLFVALGMLVGPALGLITALMLNRKVRFQAFFRTAYFLPVMTSAIVVAMVWRLLYDPNGILNYAFGAFGIKPVNWLTDPHVVMFAIAAASIWQGFGFETVIFLAALQSIPRELYEAATLDGAGSWRKFWNVTMPGLTHVLFFVFCVGIIGSFQVFDIPYALMNGSHTPNQDMITMVYYLFCKFRDLKLGYASSIAYVLFVILMLVSLFQWFITERKK